MNKHFVILPDGTKATRNSKSRVYTHCVAVRDSYDYDLATFAKEWRSDRDNHAYSVACADGEHHHAQSLEGDPDWRVDSARRCRLRGKEYVAKYGRDVDAAVAQLIAERRAYVEEEKASGGYDSWGVVGWSGRRELAEKLAAHERNSGRRAEVVILEAQLEG